MTSQGALKQQWDLQEIAVFLRYLPSELEAVWVNKGADTQHWNIFVRAVHKTKIIRLFHSPDLSQWMVYLLKEYRFGDIADCGGLHIVTLRVPEDDLQIMPNGSVLRVEYMSQAAHSIFHKLYTKYSYLDPDRSMKICHFRVQLGRRAELQRSLNQIHGSTLIGFISSLGGWKELYIQERTELGIHLTDDHDLQFLVWVPPWAIEVTRKVLERHSGYLQLDCSFRATKPYVYCVPQLIYCNCSVPVGLIIGPTESERIYNRWYQLYVQAHESEAVHLPIYPILSDNGKALASFCTSVSAEQFLCHRHILEAFGSSSRAAIIAKRMLECLTQDDIDRLLPETVADVMTLYRDGNIDTKTLNKFERFLGIKYDTLNDTPELTGTISIEPEAARMRALWSISCRGPVNRCSNHAETFHGHVNQAMRRVRSADIFTAVRALVGCIERSKNSFNERLCEKLREKTSKLRTYAERLRKPDLTNDRDCTCDVALRNSLLYGTEPFCVHSVSVKDVKRDQADLMDLNSVSASALQLIVSREILLPAKYRGRDRCVLKFVKSMPDNQGQGVVHRFAREASELFKVSEIESGILVMGALTNLGVNTANLDAASPEVISNIRLGVWNQCEEMINRTPLNARLHEQVCAHGREVEEIGRILAEVRRCDPEWDRLAQSTITFERILELIVRGEFESINVLNELLVEFVRNLNLICNTAENANRLEVLLGTIFRGCVDFGAATD